MSRARPLPVLVALTLLASGAQAQDTPTPDAAATATATIAAPMYTHTPPPVAPACGAPRIRLNWSSKRPDIATISISATRCPMPGACAGAPAAGAITTAPTRVEIVDASRQVFAATFTSPPLNTSGCPGRDLYKGPPGTTDKLRLIFGSATTAIAFLRIPLATPGLPPVLTPPLSFQIRDASRYAIGGTTSRCIVNQSATSLKVKCF